MRAKVFQARVDDLTTRQLLAIQRAEEWTDSQLIKRACELILDEADQNLSTIVNRADAMRDFITGKTQAAPERGSRDDEVGPGGKTFQGRIKGPEVDRLLTLADIEGWTESQLVRRGLKLVIEEASRDIDQILNKLQAEYDAALRAIGTLSSDAERQAQERKARIGAGVSGAPRRNDGSSSPVVTKAGNTGDASEAQPAQPPTPSTANRKKRR